MKRITKLFFISFLTISLCSASVVFAFNGPSGLSPGTGNGALQIDASGNIGFGTNLATPTGDATNANFGRVITVASSSDPGLALRNLSTSGGKYILFARANGRFAVWDDTAGRPRFFIESNGNVGIPGSALTFSASSTLHVNGSIQTEAAFVGSVPASSVVAGAFQSSNYTFPSALAIGTTTVAGLPTNGLYVAGNVGIGTISPTGKFNIETNNTSGNTWINLTTTGGNPIIRSAAGLFLRSGSTDQIFIADSGTVRVALGNAGAGTGQFNIDSTGNVGIGTTAPGKKLDVSGSIRSFYSGGSADITLLSQLDSGWSPSNVFLRRANTAGTGSVPAGTTLSQIISKAYDTDGTDTDVGTIQVIQGTPTATTVPGDIAFLTNPGTNNTATEKMRILSGGNVGIGTNAPAQKLSVVGVIESTTGGFKFPDGTTQTTAGGGGSSSIGWSRTGTNVYLTTSTDWVGIGTTTPTQALHVQGNAYISGNITTGGTMTTNVGASNVSAGSFGTTAGKGNYRFEGAATTNDVLKIDATNERVGVGTASPGYTLDVNGILNVATGFRVAGSAASTNYLRGNGTNFVASTIQASDVPVLNQNTSGYSGLLISEDNRTISPSELAANRLKFGFTTYNNNNSSPYADFLHMRSYTDLTGGSDNLLVFNKSTGLGMRLFQGAYGTTTPYATYKDVVLADNSPAANYLTKYTGVGNLVSVSNSQIYDNGTSIGVGTTSPASTLHVVGDIRASGNVIAGGTMTANVGAGNVSAGTFGTTAGKGNYVFEAAANTNNVLKVDATNERVGIGTGSPGYQLHLSSSNSSELMIEGSNTGYNNAAVVFKANNGTNQRALGDYYFDTTGQVEWFSGRPYNNSDQFIIARKSSTAAHDQATAQTSNSLFTILSNGKVGIGTSTPAAALHALSTTEQLRLGYNNANYGSFTVSSAGDMNYTSGGGDEFDFWNGVTGSNYVDIGQGGSGEKQLRMFNGGGVVNLFSTTGNSYITAGNFGIGTTSPGEPLHIKTNETGAGTSLFKLDNSGTVSNEVGMELFTSTSDGTSANRVGRIYGKFDGGSFIDARLTLQSMNSGNVLVDTLSLKNGNVGIGTTTPAYKLDVNGTGEFMNPVIVGSPSAVNHATTKSYVDSLLTGGTTSGNLSTLIVTGTTTLASTGGAVTIGGAGPALKLNVLGQGQFNDTLSATKYYDYNDPTYYTDQANTGTSEKLAGSIQSDGAGTSYIIGNTLIGVNTNPGSYKFAVSGTSYFSNQVTVNANLLLGASQNITLQTGNITGVNKITAAIIDPLYEIDGKKYATYGSDTVGVKTEMFGKGKLSLNKDAIYDYVIDFAKAEKGSDLWVFWQTIKAGEEMKDVTLTLTSEGERAELWYKLNPKEKQIMVYGDAPVKFSYHLVAPRHDAEKWTTKRETDEKASFILKEK